MARFGAGFLQEVLGVAKTPLGQFMGEEGGGQIQGSVRMGDFWPTAQGSVGLGMTPMGSVNTNFGDFSATFAPMQQAWAQAAAKKAADAKAKAAASGKKQEPQAPTQYGRPSEEAIRQARPDLAPQRAQPGATPAATGAIDQSSREAFLKTAMPYFQQVEAQTGIPAEAMAAIAINEGATAPGTLAYSSGAPFGIKSRAQGPDDTDLDTGYPVTRVQAWEVVGGRNVMQPSAFVQFPDPVTAIQGFVQFLERNERYRPALAAAQQGTTPQQFIGMLAQAGYATDPAWTTKLASIANEASRYRQQPQQTQAEAVVSEIPGQERGGIRGVSQNDYARAAGLDRATAAAICGPAAVDAFVRQNGGRTPSVTEAFDIASRNGYWSQSTGMYGPQATKAVIERMGVPANIVPARTDTLAREVTLGRLAIVNTRGHYYQAIGYDPETDRFQWGDAVGGGRWARLDQIREWGYGIPDVAIIAASTEAASPPDPSRADWNQRRMNPQW